MSTDWQTVLLPEDTDLALRPITEADLDFLECLYASTRQDELAMVDWSREQKDAFLAQQFRAQHTYYRETFPGARFLLLERAGERIGRVYLDERADEIRLIDIALLPDQRGRGLGTALMERLLAGAGGLGLPVRLHVESFNPAYRLYERLGFEWEADRGVYQFMEWRPRSS